MRYIIATLGCKVNQYESEAMEELLRADGHTPCREGEEADALLVNSCAVTAESARKVRQTVRRLRKDHPGAVLGICGCWSQIERADAAALGADVLFGTGDRRGFVKAVEEAYRDRGEAVESFTDPFRREGFEELPAGAYAGHARAYLKIEDGCANFCSYCIIPYARGRVLSLPAEKCAEEAKKLASDGYREIVLTGIEIASWGKDLRNGQTLIDAVETVAAAVPDVRLHLGSLEPTVVTEDFVERLSKLNVCRHFHLSMQSGCDETLRRMHRKYDSETFFAVTERLRRAFPGCGITTDLITGFPGETEVEFAATLAFIRKCDFSAMHIFPYSVRPGTKAAELPAQVEKAEKERRAKRASAVAAECRDAFLRSSVSQTLPVLFETEKDGVCTGHSDTYLEVEVPGTALRGLVKNVRITGVCGDKLVGLLI